MPTLKDIARECGVSANTVSCVLNNKPGQVSAQTRDRILKAVRGMGYRPSAAARRMVGKRSNTIGIADRYSPEPGPDPYKAQVLEPLIHAARAARWDVLYYSGHTEEGGFPAFLDGRSDGLICFTGAIAPDEIADIQQTGLPIVFIGEPKEEHGEPRSSVIDVDNEAGAYLAVSHLTALGHVRIAMLQGVGISGNERRVAGYKRAITDAGIQMDETRIFPTTAWEQDAYEKCLHILSQPSGIRPTAYFCFNDVVAFGLMRAAAEIGLQVPGDISIVGFDDVAAASSTIPPLTTVRQPLEWIADRAVQMLIGIIEERLPRDYHEVVRPALVLRSSTASLPA